MLDALIFGLLLLLGQCEGDEPTANLNSGPVLDIDG